MLLLLTHAILAISLAAPCLAQTGKVPLNRFASDIPKEETLVLAGIVEDAAGGALAARQGGDSSPAYTLYSVALPIPPVAQVQQ